jgi:ribonuclease III
MEFADILDLTKPHISREEIQIILGGIKPRSLENYRRALVHKSISKHIRNTLEQGLPVCDYLVEGKQPASNERLEFLGDAILDFIVSEYLYLKFPSHDEGFLTRLKIKIVKGTHCVKFSKFIGLGKHILVSNIVKKNEEGECNDKLMEDAFEAFLAAIKLDLGFKFANDFVIKLIEKYVNFEDLLYDDNYKDILMRYTQSKKIDLPIYKLISHEGPPHKRIFTMSVSLKIGDDEKEMGIGVGSSKKDAEQLAAKNTLEMIDPEDLGNLPGRDLSYI